jgi:hypothetical protein
VEGQKASDLERTSELLHIHVGESKVSPNGRRTLNSTAHDVIFDHNDQF